MIGVIAVIVVAAVVAFVIIKHRAVQNELETIVSDISTTVDKLETFIADKGLQISDHLEEAALHQKHADVKQADAARATRIRDKLNELLA